MHGNLFLNGGLLELLPGTASSFQGQLLPAAVVRHSYGAWGHLCLQELEANSVLVRHFWINAVEDVVITNEEVRHGLQSLVSVKGGFAYAVQGLKKVFIGEKEFFLFNRGDKKSELFFEKGRSYSIFNAHYDTKGNEWVLSHFPAIQKSVQKGFRYAKPFLKNPLIARFSIHDTIQTIFYERYRPTLEKAYIESRMKTTLLTLLAQAGDTPKSKPASIARRLKATAVKDVMLEDPIKRLTIKEVADILKCSESSIKKSFAKVYNSGVAEFFREQRMLLARERLLQGEMMKVVAIEMGVSPRNFSKEFKAFFGYTITDLLNGLG